MTGIWRSEAHRSHLASIPPLDTSSSCTLQYCIYRYIDTCSRLFATQIPFQISSAGRRPRYISRKMARGGNAPQCLTWFPLLGVVNVFLLHYWCSCSPFSIALSAVVAFNLLELRSLLTAPALVFSALSHTSEALRGNRTVRSEWMPGPQASSLVALFSFTASMHVVILRILRSLVGVSWHRGTEMT